MKTEESLAKDKRDIKRNLRVKKCDSGVFVYAIAVNKSVFDRFLTIPAKFGVPICNECYDMVKDVYYVRGKEYLYIGSIPVNYRLVDNTNSWSSDIPLPTSVMKRYMTAEQKKRFADWKAGHPNCCVEFLQILNVH